MIKGNHLYHYHYVDDQMNVNYTIGSSLEVKSTIFDFHFGHRLPMNVMTSYASISKVALSPMDMISTNLHIYQFLYVKLINFKDLATIKIKLSM